MEEYTFANSSAVKFPVYIRIGSLEGFQSSLKRSTLLKRPDLRHIGSNLTAASDLYVTAQLWADSKPLTLPVQTSYRPFKATRIWNEWLELPFNISNLPLSAQLAITLWDVSPASGSAGQEHHVPFGGTTVPLFDKDDTLHKGRHSCSLHKGREADGLSSSQTPAFAPILKAHKADESAQGTAIREAEAELERLEVLVRQHHAGEVPRVDWLDKLVFAGIAKKKRELEEMQKVQRNKRLATNGSVSEAQSAGDWRFTLVVDFPRFDYPVVFTDYEYKPTPVSTIPAHVPAGGVELRAPPELHYGPGIQAGGDVSNSEDANAPPLLRIYDPEVGHKDNPAESKHRRLVRSHRTSLLDRDLKPNAKIRDELNTIMSYGPTQELNGEEKDLVWKFRHHLTREKRALTKFVKSVTWPDPNESRQAIQLLPRWTEIDVDDALELLGPTFESGPVRAYAVDRLRKADDDELLLYLLQLVQALKFEKLSLNNDSSTRESSLATFLITRASQNIILGNYLHWYLVVECDDDSPGQFKEHRKLFQKVEFDFMTQLEATAEGTENRKQLKRQGELITVLTNLCRSLQRYGQGNRQKMISHLKEFLADKDDKNGLKFDPPLRLPLDPEVQVVGVFPDDVNVFKSSLTPILINFKTTTGQKYPVIFKYGDDLRQDQLVIQIISLMDRLLRKENLDLKLTPYKIIATAPIVGGVQFVPSISLQAAKTKYSSNFVLDYLRANSPDKTAEYGVRKEAMENYVKSCAGYCVVTYLLGVGDRHLDNLLLSPDGRFFHADFGYMLGRDPKPSPPPIKITAAMVEGMGGLKSDNFSLFRQYCTTAYTALRKQSSLILNLFALMTDANIPDIRAEPDKVVEKVRERFALNVSEEEAIQEFDQLIHTSLGKITGYLIDYAHDLAQRFKA